MASKNDITGDEIKSKATSSAYEDGWDRIFGKKAKTTDERMTDYVDGYPNESMFEGKDIPSKIKNRMDHLQQLMESNTHLTRMEYVLDVIESVSKFWSALSEEDKDYIQCARYAIEEEKEWNISKDQKLVINEDDGYPD